MRIALIGFQTSGKTTIFNALTGQNAATAAFGGGRAATNQAIVKVPDTRLDQMAELFKPKKFTPATVEYIDLAGIAKQEGAAQGLGDQQMVEISTADALLAVVRGFTDAMGNPPDVAGDIEAMALEMTFSDLQKVDNRLERIERAIARAQGKEKDMAVIEKGALERIKPVLEDGGQVRQVELSEDEEKSLRGFQFLTLKPTMFLVNEGEEQWQENQGKPVELGAMAGLPGTASARLCGQMEMEIAQLPPEERTEFLKDYGIEEPAAHRVIRLCYELLGVMSFFTVGEDECRAWTIPSGTAAPQAAGAIHSDLERGFIRAEVIGWEQLWTLKTYAEAKKQGKLRLEGKTYIVQDGDVLHILFNV